MRQATSLTFQDIGFNYEEAPYVPLNYPRARMVAPSESHQSSLLSVSSLTKVTSVKSLLTMSQSVSESVQ